MTMEKTPLTLEAVEAAALRAGASKSSIFKWRQRGIPAAWQLRIIIGSSGEITAEEMLVFSEARVAGVKAIRTELQEGVAA